MKLLLTAGRIRTMIANAATEKDIELTLRAHKVKYTYDTGAGFLAFRIPARSGAILVYRAASRSAPFKVSAAPANPLTACCYPYPVPRYTWND